MTQDEEQPGGQRDTRRNPHGGIKVGEVGARGPLRITRRLPFEEAFAGYQQPHQRPADGIDADEGVISQKGQGEKNLTELPSARAGYSMQMQRPWQILRLTHDIDHSCQRSGQRDDSNHHPEANPAEFGHEQPTPEQHKQQRNGNEAAPQIVEYFPLRQH